MPESPMVGARVPQEWQQQISAIAEVAGAVKGAISKLEDRVAKLEQKLADLCRGSKSTA